MVSNSRSMEGGRGVDLGELGGVFTQNSSATFLQDVSIGEKFHAISGLFHA